MAITDDFLAIAPAPLAGVSASKRGDHPRWRVSRQANVVPTLRAQCVHMPHTGCAAAYVRSGYCLRVSTCWVCPCARCSCAVVTLARLGVTILSVGWGVVRSSDSTWSGSAFFAPLSWAPAVAVSVVYPSLLQLRWFTRMPQWKNSFPMAIPTALMRGHTHAGEGSLYCQQAFGCPASMPCAGKGPQVPRRHRSEGTDLLRSACPARTTHRML